MSSPNFNVYEGDVADGINPRRPGLDDVGGGQKLDDSEFPPDPVTMFTAKDFNEMSFLLVALAKLTGAALIYVSNSGSPAITSLRAGSSTLVAGDFLVTDNGNGDTSISCPATKIMAPMACLPFPQKVGDYRASGRLNGTGDGIRIETRNSAGTLTDSDFFVIWA